MTLRRSANLGMKFTRAEENPRSPMLERRVTSALRAEKIPKSVGPRARAMITVKIIPTRAIVPRPVKLISVSLVVWAKKILLILSTELF